MHWYIVAYKTRSYGAFSEENQNGVATTDPSRGRAIENNLEGRR